VLLARTHLDEVVRDAVPDQTDVVLVVLQPHLGLDLLDDPEEPVGEHETALRGLVLPPRPVDGLLGLVLVVRRPQRHLVEHLRR
jgi:hypothetical protein